VRGRVGILDWYTVSVAVFTTVLLSAHGATYLRLKTDGEIHARSARLARWLWTAVLVLLPIVSLETWVVRPALYGALVERPAGWLAGAALLAGAWALVTGLRGTAEWRAFGGSCAIIAGLLAGAAVGMFPVMLQSTIAPEHSLTAYGGASPAHGLALALLWWPVALALALTYFVFVLRHYLGKVGRLSDR
jgi:cytochrome d ubiquinol oxidase subunit II